MTSYATKLNALLDDFIAGRSDYMALWSAFMTFWNDEIPDDGLSPEQWRAHEGVYDLLDKGAADPIAPEDRAVGRLGEAEVRSRLRALRARL